MAGFQLDGISASPVFDPAAIVARAEPRRDDSFEDHLRRTETPQSPVRDTKPSASPAAESESRSEPPPSSERATSQIAAQESQGNSAAETPETSASGKSRDDESVPDETTPPDSVALAGAQPVLVAEDPTPLPSDELLDETLAALDDEQLDADLAARAKASLETKNQADGLKSSPTGAEEAGVAIPDLDAEQIRDSASPSDERPSGRERQDTAREPGDSVAEKATLAGESNLQSESAAVPVEGIVTALAGSQRNATGRDRQKERAEANQVEGVEPGIAATPVATIEPAQIPATIEPTSDELSAKSTVSGIGVGESGATANSSGAIAAPHARSPRDFLTRAGEPAGPESPLTEAEQSRFVQRVARAFHSAASQDGEIRLRLSPPELGSLRLEVKIQGGVLSARVETETSAARTLLLENLPALRERLAEQNIRVEHFDVDLMSRQGGGQQGRAFQDREAASGFSLDGSARFAAAEESIETPAPTRPARRAGDGQLNVLV